MCLKVGLLHGRRSGEVRGHGSLAIQLPFIVLIWGQTVDSKSTTTAGTFGNSTLAVFTSGVKTILTLPSSPSRLHLLAHWALPLGQAPSSSPAAVTLQPWIPPADFPAPLAGTFFFAVGFSCRCVVVLVPPVWLQSRQTRRLSSNPVLWVWFGASKCLLDP